MRRTILAIVGCLVALAAVVVIVEMKPVLIALGYNLSAPAAGRGSSGPGDVSTPVAASQPPPEPPEDRLTRQRLHDTVVSFTFSEQPLREAFDFLQTLGNVNIVLDAGALADPNQTVTLKLSKVSLAAALRLALEQIGLGYTVRDGVVVVAKVPASVARGFALEELDAPASRRVRKLLQETVVSFTFTDQPVREALDFLQTLGNVNIVLDAGALSDPNQTVTLKLSNVSLASALRLLAEQIGMTCIVRDGVVLIGKFEVPPGSQSPDFPKDLPPRQNSDETVISFSSPGRPVRMVLDCLQP